MKSVQSLPIRPCVTSSFGVSNSFSISFPILVKKKIKKHNKKKPVCLAGEARLNKPDQIKNERAKENNYTPLTSKTRDDILPEECEEVRETIFALF